MGALRKDRVEAHFGANYPGAVIPHELVANLSDYVIAGIAGLELRGRQEQNARKCRADEAQEAKPHERAKAAPSEPAEEIASRPKARRFAAFPRALQLREFLQIPPQSAELGVGKDFGLRSHAHSPRASRVVRLEASVLRGREVPETGGGRFVRVKYRRTARAPYSLRTRGHGQGLE